jgi:uncharacterized metal-binding protein
MGAEAQEAERWSANPMSMPEPGEEPMNTTCGAGGKAGEIAGPGYEIARVEKTRNVCPMCEEYARRQASKPVAVMCCEGACLRGEVARQAANILCHSLVPDQTVRICLGGAFTKDTGQRSLVRSAARVIALEGCFLTCSSRMMRGVIGDLEPEIIIADRLYEFDRRLFGVDEMPCAEMEMHAQTVAAKVAERLQQPS